MMRQKKTVLATLAAILIISTAVFVSLEMSQKEAYGQQVPVIPASRERTVYSTGSAVASISPDLV
ncbi:MAG: hypothetical protein D4R90_05655, partial [Nitrosopumilales archaeon]